MNDIDTRDCSDPVFRLNLYYPRHSPCQVVEIDLEDVRAADGLRIHYDFERDGWSIQQAAVFGWPADDPVQDSDWQEVAFVKAWARERKESE